MANEKDPIYARIAMVGESDSGKSFSSLVIGSQLAAGDKTRLLDTEFRGKLYRTKFPIAEIITLDLPFEVSKAMEVIESCRKNGTELLIMDSCSPFWDRIVDVSDEMKATVKDGRRIWAKLTPMWDKFKMAINAAPFHIITTWKMKDVMSLTPGGPATKKVITRGGGKALKFDYHLVFSLDENRQARVVKDNYDLFSDWREPKQIDAEVGKKIATWLKNN